MVQKRPFDNEEVYDVSSKHPRHLEKQLVSILEFVSSEDSSQQPHNFGQDFFKNYKIEVEQKFRSGGIPEIPKHFDKEIEFSAPGCILGSPWTTSSSCEEDVSTDAPFHVVCFPEDCGSDCPIRTPAHSEEIYSLLLKHPPRKLVPVGPDHQAVIPEWCPLDTKNFVASPELLTSLPQNLDSDLIISKDDEMKLIGSCVIPMPEPEAPAYSEEAGISRTDCSCQDAGSIRCVRQHITEAREKLRKTLGQERFVELGFCYMGEVVAENWSEEDERLFHEVVFSNPASLGKNFWENLSMVFPSRTKQDIVSYYFNVFMLQRRAEQNRCDTMDIDSDNDEWQGSDEDDSDEELPVHKASHRYTQTSRYDLHDYAEDATCDNNENIISENDKAISRTFETFPWKLRNDCNSNPIFHRLDKTSCKEWGGHDVHGHSCTSFDSGAGSQETQKKAESSDNWPGNFSGFRNGQEYVLEHCDAKVWDAGYMNCLGNKFDFLPTCSVIEEVFGNGDSNYKGRDGEGLS